MNIVLNKLIRDKQPPEVIEAARQKGLKTPQPPDVDPKFAEIFLRDANRSLAALDELMEKGGPRSEEDLRIYTIHTHGMKSALANMGKMDLSAIALKLEQLGRDKNTEAIENETPAFLSSLRAFTEELSPKQEKPTCDESLSGEGEAFLRGELLAIKAACEEYDVSSADEILIKLREKAWPPPVTGLLSTISEHLLHSNFDEAVETVSGFMEAAAN
jgi:HPt (histidine-containing phosphotransfer) domain-containing protein